MNLEQEIGFKKAIQAESTLEKKLTSADMCVYVCVCVEANSKQQGNITET